MIILDDQYRIDADNYGYMLYRDGGVNANDVPARLGAIDYSTIGQALQSPCTAVQRDTVQGGTNTLPEAMDVSTALLGGVRRMSDRMDEEVAHD